MFDREIFGLDDARRFAIICAIYSALDAFSTIGMAAFLADVICSVWAGELWYEKIWLIVLFAVCFFAKAVFSFGQSCSSARFAKDNTVKLQTSFLESLFMLGAYSIDKGGSASFSVESITGIEKTEQYLSTIIPKTINMIVVPLFLAIYIFTQDVISGVIVTVSYPLIILFMRLIGFTARDDSRKRHSGFMRMSDHFSDAVRGLSTLRVFGVQKLYSNTVFTASEAYRKMTMKTLRVATLSSTVLDIFATCSLAAVAIMLGFRMVEGSLAFFPALVVLVIVPEFFRPIRKYASDYHATLEGKSSFDNICAVVNRANTLSVGHIEKDDSKKEKCISNALANALLYKDLKNPEKGMLVLEDISFSYDVEASGLVQGFNPEGTNVLRGVSLCISPREKIALIGPSGCGKTTLLDILAGMISPQSGKFSVDGCNIFSLNRRQWKSRIAFITQDPHIFKDSIRENVRFYCPGASDSQIMEALRCVGLDGIVERLPEGLNTIIGEGAMLLSGGQMQRIALARAVIDSKRDIWILDEPTEHLDVETELELKGVFEGLMENKTVILSTHRHSWLDSMDTVIQLNDGCIQSITNNPIKDTADKNYAKPYASIACDMVSESDCECIEASEQPADVWRSILIGAKGSISSIVMICLLGVIAYLFASGLMFTSGFMISLAASIPFTVLALHIPSIFVRIFGIGKPLIDYIRRLKSHNWVLSLTSRLRVGLFNAADAELEHNMRQGSPVPDSKKFLAVFSDVIESIQNIYIRGLFPAICAGACAILMACVLYAFSLYIGFVFTLMVGIIMVAIPLLALNLEKRIGSKTAEARIAALSNAADDMLGLRDWVLSGRMFDFVERAEKSFQPIRKYQDISFLYEHLRTLVCNLIYCVLIVLMLIWASDAFGSAELVKSNAVAWLLFVSTYDANPYAPNWIAAFVLCLFPLAEVFFPMSDYILEIQSRKKSIINSNVQSILVDKDFETKSDSCNKPVNAECEANCIATINDASTENLELRIEDEVFFYEGSQTPALNVPFLDISSGQHVAVIGRSGSGKSTLAKILAGQLSVRNPIRGGRNVRCAFLDQQPHIFSQSLRDNLLIGNIKATDDQLKEALEAVGLGYLARRSEGLDTPIEESGRNLSGGERERIALARALLSDADLFILDEPFAGLDQATADSITEMLLDVFANKTIIMVTHNLSKADKFHRVIVMDNGVVALDGSADILAVESPYFAELLNLSKGI